MKICIWGIRRSGNSPIRNWLAEQTGLESKINCTLDDLKDDMVNSIEEHPVSTLEKVDADRKIIILRDPYNLFASRIKHYDLLSSRKKWINANMVKHLWIEYAKAILNPNGYEVILFNDFIKKYRPKKVDDNGGGSSFDGLKYDGRGNEMPVFDRWKEYADLECFINLFTNEIKELSCEIFRICHF